VNRLAGPVALRRHRHACSRDLDPGSDRGRWRPGRPDSRHV